ncbi:unnamed protein product, partial [Amoebophrya sp. A25]
VLSCLAFRLFRFVSIFHFVASLCLCLSVACKTKRAPSGGQRPLFQ